MNSATITRRLNKAAKASEWLAISSVKVAGADNYTERDREVSAEMLAAEMLREFMATEL